jgi:F420-dependent oxidoreductase-like protein
MPTVIEEHASTRAYWANLKRSIAREARVKFSVWFDVCNPWPELLNEAVATEKMGYDGLWISDHYMPNLGDISGPWMECWTTMAALAALVPRVRIGSLVVGNSLRTPAVLAKQVAQVDVISNGRCVLGIGAGYYEREHDAYGIELGSIGDRHRKLVEAIQVIRSLFENDRTDFDGRYYKLKDAPLSPKPVQERLPILIGGRGEKVMLSIVAQYADEWNIGARPDDATHVSKVLDEHCERIGRDPQSIRRTVCSAMLVTDDPAMIEAAASSRGWSLAGSAEAMKEQVGRYRELGFDEVILLNHFWGTEKAVHLERFQRFMEEVAPEFHN